MIIYITKKMNSFEIKKKKRNSILSILLIAYLLDTLLFSIFGTIEGIILDKFWFSNIVVDSKSSVLILAYRAILLSPLIEFISFFYGRSLNFGYYLMVRMLILNLGIWIVKIILSLDWNVFIFINAGRLGFYPLINIAVALGSTISFFLLNKKQKI